MRKQEKINTDLQLENTQKPEAFDRICKRFNKLRAHILEEETYIQALGDLPME